MALPTAPLGQLGNMTMPYAIPTYEVRRGRDQVLTALAAGIAQQLGSQLVENAMSRDYAENPAGFWSKLVAGPKENRAQFETRQERTMKAEQAEKDRLAQMAAKDREIELARWLQGRRETESAAARDLEREINQAKLWQMGVQADNEAALRRELAQRGHEAQLAQIDRQATHTGRLNRETRTAQQAFQQAMAQIELENQIQLLKERAALEAGSPQGRYYAAQAAMLEQQAAELSRQLSQRLGGATPTAADLAGLIDAELDNFFAPLDNRSRTQDNPVNPPKMTLQDYLDAGFTREEAQRDMYARMKQAVADREAKTVQEMQQRAERAQNMEDQILQSQALFLAAERGISVEEAMALLRAQQQQTYPGAVL